MTDAETLKKIIFLILGLSFPDNCLELIKRNTKLKDHEIKSLPIRFKSMNLNRLIFKTNFRKRDNEKLDSKLKDEKNKQLKSNNQQQFCLRNRTTWKRSPAKENLFDSFRNSQKSIKAYNTTSKLSEYSNIISKTKLLANKKLKLNKNNLKNAFSQGKYSNVGKKIMKRTCSEILRNRQQIKQNSVKFNMDYKNKNCRSRMLSLNNSLSTNSKLKTQKSIQSNVNATKDVSSKIEQIMPTNETTGIKKNDELKKQDSKSIDIQKVDENLNINELYFKEEEKSIKNLQLSSRNESGKSMHSNNSCNNKNDSSEDYFPEFSESLESENNNKIPILFVDVSLPNSKVEKLVIYEGDDSSKIVHEFSQLFS